MHRDLAIEAVPWKIDCRRAPELATQILLLHKPFFLNTELREYMLSNTPAHT